MSSKWRQWEDLPPEEEEQLIDKIARSLVKRRMGLPAQLILESGGPMTSLFAKFWMGIYAPYLDFFGIDKHMALLRKRENVERLLSRIDELEEEEAREEHQQISRDKCAFLSICNIMIVSMIIVDLAHFSGLINVDLQLLTITNLAVLPLAYVSYRLKRGIRRRLARKKELQYKKP